MEGGGVEEGEEDGAERWREEERRNLCSGGRTETEVDEERGEARGRAYAALQIRDALQPTGTGSAKVVPHLHPACPTPYPSHSALRRRAPHLCPVRKSLMSIRSRMSIFPHWRITISLYAPLSSTYVSRGWLHTCSRGGGYLGKGRGGGCRPAVGEGGCHRPAGGKGGVRAEVRGGLGRRR